MNDNLQQLSGFSVNLTRNQMSNEGYYDSANIEALIAGGAISDRYIKELRAEKITTQILNAQIATISPSKIEDGTLSNTVNVGATNIKIDGDNNRITINDGTNDRILLGFLSGKF